MKEGTGTAKNMVAGGALFGFKQGFVKLSNKGGVKK